LKIDLFSWEHYIRGCIEELGQEDSA